jgi:hypothetical protein
MEGDTFEMEDQRNWSDASLKTYCTPLEQARPVQVREGTEVSQKVMLSLEGKAPARPVESKTGRSVVLSVGEKPGGPVPSIGLTVSSRLFSEEQAGRLASLKPGHLRVEVDPYGQGWEGPLREAGAWCRRNEVDLVLAVTLGENPAGLMAEVCEAVSDAPIALWLVYPQPGGAVCEDWMRQVRGALKGEVVGTGSAHNFTELNRNHPPCERLDVIAFACNPQVHVFDDASMFETLEMQGMAVRDAKRICPEKPVAVGPVTLQKPGKGGPDPRQMSLLCAAWTAGSIKYLAENGASGVTYFETSGPSGVMPADGDQSVSGSEGGVFPVYHVLADVTEFSGGLVVVSESGDPLSAEVFAFEKDGVRRIIVANTSGYEQAVQLGGLEGRGRMRILDETTAERATKEPQAFRDDWLEAPIKETLQLKPYAVVTMDIEEE